MTQRSEREREGLPTDGNTRSSVLDLCACKIAATCERWQCGHVQPHHTPQCRPDLQPTPLFCSAQITPSRFTWITPHDFCGAVLRSHEQERACIIVDARTDEEAVGGLSPSCRPWGLRLRACVSVWEGVHIVTPGSLSLFR